MYIDMVKNGNEFEGTGTVVDLLKILNEEGEVSINSIRFDTTNESTEFMNNANKSILETYEVQYSLNESEYFENLKELHKRGIKINEDLLVEIAMEDFDILNIADKSSLDDIKFIKRCSENPYSIIYASDRIIEEEEELVKHCVSESGSLIGNLPDKYRDNKEYAMLAIEDFDESVEFISDRLKDNEEVISFAMSKDISNLFAASDRLKNDYNFLSPYISKMLTGSHREEKIYERLYKHLGENIKNNRNISLNSIKYVKENIKHITEELSNDYDFLEDCLKAHGNSILSLANKDALLTLSIQYPEAINYIDEELKKDKDFQLKAVDTNILNLKYMYLSDKEVLLKAIEKSKGDYNLDNCFPIQFDFNSEYKNDYEVCLKSVQKNPESLKSLGDDMIRNKDIVIEAVKQDGVLIRYSEIFQYNKEIGLICVKQNGDSLKFLKDNLKKDIEICEIAVRNSLYAIDNVSEDLKNKYGWDQDTFLTNLDNERKMNKPNINDSQIENSESTFVNKDAVNEKELNENISYSDLVKLVLELKEDIKILKNQNRNTTNSSDVLIEKNETFKVETLDECFRKMTEDKELEEKQLEDSKNEVSTETLLKLNEQNKELLKESTITKEDNKLSSIKSNSKDIDNSTKEEVKTSNHKQR
jgi:hypothetical protein